MALFNFKKAPQEPAEEKLQDKMIPETVETSALEATEVSEALETPKKVKEKEKKSILTMDMKDLVKMKPKSKKGAVKLNKRTMNFVHHQSNFNPMKVLPPVLVIVAALTVFVQVGFLDLLDQKTVAYSQLATRQEQLAAVNTRLVGYDELAAEYGRYSYGWMSESEVNMVNRLDVLDLVEDEIIPYASLENFAVNNNVLTMNIYGITLDEASIMVNRLEQRKLVESASVYSASAEDGVEARIFLSINLTKEAEA